MKLKENFVLRQVADVWVVLPLGAATVNFDGMIKLNETGALLWRTLETGADCAALAETLMQEYEVDREIALADAQDFVCRLQEAGCIEA